MHGAPCRFDNATYCILTDNQESAAGLGQVSSTFSSYQNAYYVVFWSKYSVYAKYIYMYMESANCWYFPFKTLTV